MMANRPPQIRSNIQLGHRYRFVNGTDGVYSITGANIFGAAGVMATTAILGHSFYGSFKIRRVSMWAPPSAQGAAATVSCNWEQGATVQTNTTEVSDTSNSVSTPACIATTPPRGSLASFWQNTNVATPMFTLAAPAGCIIDVELDLVIYDEDPGGTSVTTVLVGATPGNVYYTPLDGHAGQLAPVSLTQG